MRSRNIFTIILYPIIYYLVFRTLIQRFSSLTRICNVRYIKMKLWWNIFSTIMIIMTVINKYWVTKFGILKYNIRDFLMISDHSYIIFQYTANWWDRKFQKIATNIFNFCDWILWDKSLIFYCRRKDVFIIHILYNEHYITRTIEKYFI